MIAVGNGRIAIIAAALDQIQLVAARRTHFHFPQAPVAIEGDAQRVAMAERPDLRAHPARRGEGIIVGNAASVGQPQYFAEIGVHILRGIELLPLTRADVEHAIGSEGEAVAEMAVAADQRCLLPNDFEVWDTAHIFGQPGATDKCPRSTISRR